MNHLVCNTTTPASGRHLYTRSGHLVCTPITRTFTLHPSGQALYEVGDEYKLVLPTSDFFTTSGQGIFANIAGHHMRQCYLGTYTPSHDSQGWRQIWRNNDIFTLAPDSGYVFYNGGYSPAKGFTGGAAYMRIPAYKFTLPNGVAGYNWNVESVKITVKTHGIVIGSGSFGTVKTNPNQYPVFAKDANTALLPAGNDWRESTRPMRVGAFSETSLQATAARDMYSQCQEEIQIPNATTDAVANRGAAGGNAYQLWESWPGGQVTYSDGKIINAPNNPASAVFTMPAAFNQAVASLMPNGAFFVAMIPEVSDSGGTGAPTSNDYPFYTPASFGQSNAWWLCERHLITQLQLTLTIGE